MIGKSFPCRLFWFVLLWLGGVAATGLVSLIIKVWLKA